MKTVSYLLVFLVEVLLLLLLAFLLDGWYYIGSCVLLGVPFSFLYTRIAKFEQGGVE